MDISEILVLVVGIGLIALILFYFFGGSGTKAVATHDEDRDAAVVDIVVNGGYEPNVVEAKAGSRLILRFHREEASACSEEIVFKDFGVSRHLPAFKVTEVEIQPQNTGEFEFTCGMNMLRGKLIVT